jgi:hypothetical protein
MAWPLLGAELAALQGAKVFLPNQLPYHSGRGSHVQTTDNPGIPAQIKLFADSTVVVSLSTTTVVGFNPQLTSFSASRDSFALASSVSSEPGCQGRW